MKRKHKENLKKWGVLTLMFLTVLGFTVPGFIQGNEDPSATNYAEPTLCTDDSSCYLLCDDKPVHVLCSQNLCQRVSCDQQAYFEYLPTPISILLDVQVDDSSIDFKSRSNSKDLFVRLGNTKDTFLIHGSRMSINHIFEKFNLGLTETCLLVDQNQYCHGEKELDVFINGNQTVSAGFYVPKSNDVIKIVYG